MDERLQKQLNFILEIDKEKNIFRQTHLSGHGRRENDAEHAWHMAVMAYLLQEYSNEPVDVARVMLMCLLHDVVEIDAGDTYAYDTDGLQTQKTREDAAKQRIYSLLPDDQKLILEIAKVIRVGFLQQNAFHKDDTCVPMEKQFKMMEIILYLYRKSRSLISMGMPMSVLKEDPIFDQVIAIKYDVPNDNLAMLDDYKKKIDAFYDGVIERNA